MKPLKTLTTHSPLFQALLLLVMSVVAPNMAYAVDCPVLPVDITSRIEKYIGQRIVSGTDDKPLIISMELLPNNCFHKVSIAIPHAPSPVILYLSPDGRYLTTTFYDLNSNPSEEVSRIASNVQSILMRDEPPQPAGSNRIILVEFIDYQCPYCKRFSGWYSNLPEALRSQAILVFKNLPLAQHEWSRIAASCAICVNRQSPSAFYRLAEMFFEKQAEITPANLKSRVSAVLTGANDVDVSQLEACVGSSNAAQTIERDIAVAKQLNVTSTPTLFINGRRVVQVTSEQELEHLLKMELVNANSGELHTQAIAEEKR
jgi:protein-disulfide isomerase